MLANGVGPAGCRRPTFTLHRVGSVAAWALRALPLAAALNCALAMPPTAQAGSSYLAVWASDKEKQDSVRTPTSWRSSTRIRAPPTYGKVVNTASLQRVPGKNLLNDLGFTEALGLTAKYNLPKSGLAVECAQRSASHVA